MPQTKKATKTAKAVKPVKLNTTVLDHAPIELAMPPNYGHIESLLIAPRPLANDAPSIIRLNTGWTNICIERVAQTMTSLPLKLYITKSTGTEKCVWNTKKLTHVEQKHIKEFSKSLKVKSAEEIEEITEHSVYDVLNTVNDDLSWTDLVKLTVQYLLLIGNAFWQIRRDAKGVPESIRVLPAEYTMVLLNNNNEMDINGYRVFNGIREEVFKKEDILHFKRVAPGLFWRISSGELKTGIYGMGAAEAILNPILLMNAIDDFERALMENMCIPSGVIQYTDGTLTPDAIKAAEASWKKAVGGLKRAGTIKVTDQNWEFKPLSLNPKDLSYQEGRKWLREVIANAIGVPLGMISPTDSNRATSLTDMANYLKFTIQPMCETFTNKINLMLKDNFDENLFADFDGVVREDNEFLLKQEENDLKYSVLTVNEVRASRGLQPVPWGNDRFVTARETQTGDIAPDSPELKPADKKPKDGEDDATS